jgi:23S rRNA pseudouridine1911/1915/1917 synthase
VPVLELTVGDEGAGGRLDVFLAGRPEIASRAAAQRLVDAGRVRVDGAERPNRHRVAAGARVAVALADGAGEEARPPPHVPHRIVFEDEHLLVVDKPAGVVVHPAPGHHGPTLAEALAGRTAGGDPGREGVVHRLDRDTSGLLVLARSDDVHRALSALVRERALLREYAALVSGRPDTREGTIDAPLGRDRDRRTVMSARTDRPREARTHFSVEETLALTALLRVRLETGRTHQIRAHLRAIDLPVVGDAAYGGRAAGERLGLARQFLHSERLALDHPVTGRRLDLRSGLPADLAAALAGARAERG